MKILRPDINESQDVFMVTDDNCIRFGLQGIRNVSGVSEVIIEERKAGKFDSMQDFVERMARRDKMDKKIIEALIYSSALDSFTGTRNAKLSISPLMLKSAALKKESEKNGQLSLFSGDFGDYSEVATIDIPNIPEFQNSYLLEKEKEFSGFFLTAHPLDNYPRILRNKYITNVSMLLENDEHTDELARKKEVLRIFGIMGNVIHKRTKKNKPFYTFTLSDKSGDIKCIAFSECLDEYCELLSEKNIVGLTGTISKNDDFGVQFIVDKVTKF